MTEVTLILRKPPEKESADYATLYKLMPKSLIYCTDFGLPPIKWHKITPEELEQRNNEIDEKIKLAKDVVPFNGATTISPLLTVYLLKLAAIELHMNDIIANTMRFFQTDVVYLDLGVHIKENMVRTRKVLDAFNVFNKDLKLGVIAPYEEYVNFQGDFAKLIGEYENIIPCPFLEPGMPIAPQISELMREYPSYMQAFCCLLSKEDALTFGKYIKEQGFDRFVFWSTLAMQDLNLDDLSQKPVQEMSIVPMVAMYSSTIRKRPSMDSPVFEDKNVRLGQTVNVRVLPSKGRQTTFGAISLDEGETGYVVLKFNGHSRFQEKEGDTHEQSVSKQG